MSRGKPGAVVGSAKIQDVAGAKVLSMTAKCRLRGQHSELVWLSAPGTLVSRAEDFSPRPFRPAGINQGTHIRAELAAPGAKWLTAPRLNGQPIAGQRPTGVSTV